MKLEKSIFINGDCMDPNIGMPAYPDGFFDLAIVDPPYGISINANMGLKKGQKKKHEKVRWDDEIPSKEYFDELVRVSKNQIIWGGNYFPLPPTKHVIFWDKKTPIGMSFSDGEIAWTSFDRAIRKVTLRNTTGDKIHPTQKPVALYQWLIDNYASEGMTILDTHVGSGSSLLAFEANNLKYVGYEINADYYKKTSLRLAGGVQTRLF
jgi:site-specific DNA-methyltransferase (adenine-specific)